MGRSNSNVAIEPTRENQDRTWYGALPRGLFDGVVPLLFVAALLLLIPAAAPLTDGDSAFYGRIAQEMLRTGDWLTPSYPPGGDGFIVDKPPLTLWLMAASFWLFGPTAFAARIWQIALSMGSILLTVGIGRLYLPRRAATNAGWILLTAVLFFYTGLVPQQDVATLFFLELTFYGFLRFLTRGGLGWYYLMWVGLAAGVLTRGPANLVMAGGTLLIFLLWQRPSLKALFSGVGRVVAHLTGGFVLFLLLAVPWFWAETQILGQPFLEVFFLSGTARYYAADHNLFITLFGYTLLLFVAFLPWSGYLPYGILHGIRGSRGAEDETRAVVARFVLVWAAFSFLFIHLVAWRVIRYLLPVLPAAALLVGDLQQAMAEQGTAPDAIRRVERIARWLTGPVLLLLGLAGVAVWAVDLPPESAVFRPLVTALGLPLGVGGAWIMVRPKPRPLGNDGARRNPLHQRLLMTGLAAYLALGIGLLTLGKTAFPQRAIVGELTERAAGGDRIVYSGGTSALFYDFYLPERSIERAGEGWWPPVAEGQGLWVITTPARAATMQSIRGWKVSEVYRASAEVLLRLVPESDSQYGYRGGSSWAASCAQRSARLAAARLSRYT